MIDKIVSRYNYHNDSAGFHFMKTKMTYSSNSKRNFNTIYKFQVALEPKKLFANQFFLPKQESENENQKIPEYAAAELRLSLTIIKPKPIEGSQRISVWAWMKRSSKTRLKFKPTFQIKSKPCPDPKY